MNLDLHQAKYDINFNGGALSADGLCRSFGKGANGASLPSKESMREKEEDLFTRKHHSNDFGALCVHFNFNNHRYRI